MLIIYVSPGIHSPENVNRGLKVVLYTNVKNMKENKQTSKSLWFAQIIQTTFNYTIMSLSIYALKI